MSNQTKSLQHRQRELARREKKELRRQLKAARREERRGPGNRLTEPPLESETAARPEGGLKNE